MRTSVAVISVLRPAGLAVGRRREAGRDRHVGGAAVAGARNRQHRGARQSAARQRLAISLPSLTCPSLATPAPCRHSVLQHSLESAKAPAAVEQRRGAGEDGLAGLFRDKREIKRKDIKTRSVNNVKVSSRTNQRRLERQNKSNLKRNVKGNVKSKESKSNKNKPRNSGKNKVAKRTEKKKEKKGNKNIEKKQGKKRSGDKREKKKLRERNKIKKKVDNTAARSTKQSICLETEVNDECIQNVVIALHFEKNQIQNFFKQKSRLENHNKTKGNKLGKKGQFFEAAKVIFLIIFTPEFVFLIDEILLFCLVLLFKNSW